MEIERKYEVPASAQLPTSQALAPAGFTADEADVRPLEATYFDTDNRDLALAGMGLRRRRGGPDEGWHIKERGPEGTRERTWPLSDAVPPGVREVVRPVIADARLAPIATLLTARTALLIRDASGAPIVELVDDWVRAVDHHTGTKRAWREWEAELVPGADPQTLDTLEAILRSCGAVPSPSPAKIARATGQMVAAARRQGASDAVLDAIAELDRLDQQQAQIV